MFHMQSLTLTDNLDAKPRYAMKDNQIYVFKKNSYLTYLMSPSNDLIRAVTLYAQVIVVRGRLQMAAIMFALQHRLTCGVVTLKDAPVVGVAGRGEMLFWAWA